MTVHTRSLKEIAILNKDLVLGDPPPPLMFKDHTFALFNFGTHPLWLKPLGEKTLMFCPENSWKLFVLKVCFEEKTLTIICYEGYL